VEIGVLVFWMYTGRRGTWGSAGSGGSASAGSGRPVPRAWLRPWRRDGSS